MPRLLLLLTLGCCVGCPKPGANDPLPPAINPVAEFQLTERSGKAVTLADMRGKIWIASFVFTRCTESCPQVSGSVARLQKDLADLPDVRFVTFTVDPARDQPDELRRYAEQYRADAQRWLFLTGGEERIQELLRDSFHVSAIRNPNAASPGQEFDHSSKLAVVDAEGNIRGYFDGMRRTKIADAEAEFERGLSELQTLVRRLHGQKR